MYKSGLVLGKFMPPQIGHKFLILSAARQCETLYVMMCSSIAQPISGRLRYDWLVDMFKTYDNINIIWCDEEHPQYPEDAHSVEEFYTKYWVPTVYSHIKYLDVVFTSETYGDEFAEYLGVKHVMIDQPRKHYSISATNIRENPFFNWDYIPDVVKPYYKKSVVIMGPESTGKSTLTKRLADFFGGDYIAEYGREYTEVSGTSDMNPQDFINIAGEHMKRVNHLRDTSTNKLLFSDTEGLTTYLLQKLYLGSSNKSIQKIALSRPFDLYIVLDIDVPWINDGTRDFPNKRKETLNMILEELELHKLPYVLISGDGDYDIRFQKALKEVSLLGYLLENTNAESNIKNTKGELTTGR